MRLPVIFGIQGIYYLLTGGWPVLDIDSFMQVSGYKTDIWLVKMVGLLTVAIAIMLLVAAKTQTAGIVILALGAAFSYITIDVYYVIKGTIGSIYLCDAVIEGVFVLLIIFSRRER